MELEELQAEDFLEVVWGKRKGWVDLPAKVAGHWIPYYTEWDGNGCGTSITRRIDASLRDGEDLYFSVGQFAERGRDEHDFLNTQWLWADLDEVHPSEASRQGLTPTIAWQSSAGRYQALWRLDRRLGPEPHARLNQALSYALGADRGGWDLTQVLRLPGTRNFKYPDAPLVSLLWYHKDLTYDPRGVWAKVKQHATKDAVRLGGQGGGTLPRRAMPAQAKAMLRVQPDAVVEGERSSQLWKLERILARAGWGEDDIYEVVVDTPWNKWARVRTGDRRLRNDIRKAIRSIYAENADDDRPGGLAQESVADSERVGEDLDFDGNDGVEGEYLPLVRYDKFMATPLEPPKWMVEGIWTENAHGIIGGEPKTLKTTLAIAMGIAVASGKPFLGTFEVPSPGPVVLIQEENDPVHVQDTMKKVAASYGLISKEEITTSPSPVGSIGSTVVDVRFPDDIPFHLLNNWRFDLTNEEHTAMLERTVQAVRPKMLFLDPFEKMIGDAELEKSHEVRRFLRALMHLRFEYDVAIVLIHHVRKQQADKPGQRLLGTTMFHAWIASALYLADKTGEDNDGWKHISIDREFREQGPQQSLKLAVKMGEPGSLDLSTVVGEWNPQDQLMDLVFELPGITMRQAAEDMGVNIKTIARRANHLPIRIEGGGKGNVRRMYPDESSS